jgi:Zn-dependent protease with chaperone function
VEALGRLSGYFPNDTAAGLFGRLTALRNEHPLIATRIRHIRKLIARQRSEPQIPIK